ncbi:MULTISPECIES: peroxiredoxin [Haloferax]|uniref:Redoxin domain-containing protein n=1 Tax=Haloferax marinum TaxID=2666143 RepID=A0A6A8G480_9EURY|nr:MULTISPECIES: deiodinase-like protein [Haloferax]KAB1196741.1 redoxin domain-containing protein [Haloferax sp. CBA1150]MRW95749.1 redoxin domain-containing protein [Haloferax marinum]
MTSSQASLMRETDTTGEYNYRHFGPEHYDFKTFDGPEPGDDAPNFEAWTLAGDEVELSDFRGSWVVLETGSITCPITDSKVRAMDKLQSQFEDVEFILLYTREAHPGERLEAHDSLEDKLARARTFADDYDVERTVLVDDVEGTAHKQYGGMPNSVHVINPDGVVVMRGDWNNVRKVKEVLENGDEGLIYKRDIYRGSPLFFTPKKGVVRVLRDAGPRAVGDFVKNVPALALMHLKKELRGKQLNG